MGCPSHLTSEVSGNWNKSSAANQLGEFMWSSMRNKDSKTYVTLHICVALNLHSDVLGHPCFESTPAMNSQFDIGQVPSGSDFPN